MVCTLGLLCGERVNMTASQRNYYLVGFSRDSTLGVKYDYKLVLRSQFFEYLRETLGRRNALERLEAARLVLVLNTTTSFFIFPSRLVNKPIFGRLRY